MKPLEPDAVPANVGEGSAAPAAAPMRFRVRVPSIHLSASERRTLLTIMDLLVVNATLVAALILRYDYTLSMSMIWEVRIYILLLTTVWLAWASFFDCYDMPRSADASQSAWCAARAGLATTLTYLAIPYYTPHFPASRASAYLFVGLATVSVPAWRALYATIFGQPVFQQRLLVVGAGSSGSELARELAGRPIVGNPYAGSGYRIVGFVDDDPSMAGTQVAGLPVLGNRSDLLRLVNERRIDTIVVAITDTPTIHPGLFKAVLDCRELGVRVEPMTAIYERLTGKVPVDHAGRNLHVVMPLSESPVQRLLAVTKRLFDLLASALGMVGLALVLPFVAAANAIWSRGPLFYAQTRVGKGGKHFRLIKLRTMVPHAESENGAVWATPGDKRITAVGRVLRKSRLDELPQVWNVLRGEMSVVGPRPERPEFVADLIREVPFYQARHAVRPGITGWAQVRYGYGSSPDDALVKLQYDLYYIRHQSLYLELSILAKTAAVILRFLGR